MRNAKCVILQSTFLSLRWSELSKKIRRNSQFSDTLINPKKTLLSWHQHIRHSSLEDPHRAWEEVNGLSTHPSLEVKHDVLRLSSSVVAVTRRHQLHDCLFRLRPVWSAVTRIPTNRWIVNSLDRRLLTAFWRSERRYTFYARSLVCHVHFDR